MAKKFSGSMSASVLKAMSIFGGVQMVTILCSVVRTKLVAILIGPVGVGLFTLYNSVIEMLSSATRLNLRQSSVRDISSSGKEQVPEISLAVRRWARWLGLSGMAIMCAMSPLLSQWTFGDMSRWWTFCVLSIVMYTSTVADGEMAILQGLQRLKRLAKASMWGVVAGTAISVPMFYMYGIDSIIPTIIVYGIAIFLSSIFYRERTPAEKRPDQTKTRTVELGRGFLALGLYLTVSSFVTQAMSYLFTIYLNHTTSTGMLGIYHAGFTIVNTYVGVVFTAISMEYYPRLASIIGHHRRSAVIVSHEISVTIWILLPVIVLFIAADQLIIQLLYSAKFVVALPYITIAITGMIFRAVSWCMAYVILARGDGIVYIITESLSGMIFLCFNIIGYRWYGLAGLGASYVAWYFLYTVIVYYFYRRRYHMTLGRGLKSQILFAVAVAAIAIMSKWMVGWWLTLCVFALILPLSAKNILRR